MFMCQCLIHYQIGEPSRSFVPLEVDSIAEKALAQQHEVQLEPRGSARSSEFGSDWGERLRACASD